MSDVRVLATRLHGDGTEAFIHNEVPMRDISVTPVLNAGYEITGTIEPQHASLIAADGKPLLEAWATAIYVEQDGEIIGGGIVADDSYDFMKQTLTTTGFADYPAGQAYVDSWVSTALDQAKLRIKNHSREVDRFEKARRNADAARTAAVAAWTALPGGGLSGSAAWTAKKKAEQKMANAIQAYERAAQALVNLQSQHVRDQATLTRYAHPACPTFTDGVDGVDPIDIFRHIWNHLQSYPGGNLGVLVDTTPSPVRLGKSVAGTVYDTDNDGDTPPFEYGEYRLAWYETTDLGEKVSELVENTPFEFWEEHHWNEDRTKIVHRVRVAYPRAGRQRDDVRIELGVNVEVPEYDNEGVSDYASGLLALGAGEGGTDISANDSGRLHAVITRDGETRIRRILSFDDPSRSSLGSLTAAARTELRAHNADYSISELAVLPGRGLDLDSLRIGDWVKVVGDVGPRDINQWYKITAIAYSPESGSTTSFSVEPL